LPVAGCRSSNPIRHAASIRHKKRRADAGIGRDRKSSMTHYQFRFTQWPTAKGRMIAVLVVMAISLTMLSPTAIAAQPSSESACPEMTDSIRRLYLAFFKRDPNPYEAHSWTNRYMAGEANLPSIAGSLAHSREFLTLWGSSTSSQFVELIHLNTDHPAPSAEELHHWTRALNTGYTRGEMTVALTESEHFVTATGTTKPLSGYLRWYPPGTHWYCGSGPRSALSVKPLVGQVVFADRLVKNEGPASASYEIATVESGLRNAVIASGSLPSGATDYLWSGSFSGDGYYGSALQIVAPASTRWAVVFYPRSIGTTRLGWQIGP